MAGRADGLELCCKGAGVAVDELKVHRLYLIIELVRLCSLFEPICSLSKGYPLSLCEKITLILFHVLYLTMSYYAV